VADPAHDSVEKRRFRLLVVDGGQTFGLFFLPCVSGFDRLPCGLKPCRLFIRQAREGGHGPQQNGNSEEELLEGIEGFSHILVLYWPHLVEAERRVFMERADGIEELFVIRHARIDFFAALVREGDGSWTIRRKAKFHDGQVIAFYHAPGNQELLRSLLIQITKAVADFYDRTFLNQKFQKGLWPWDSAFMADESWCRMN